MRIATLRQQLREHGAKPVHEERVLRQWSRALPQDAGKRRPEDFLPLALREALPGMLEQLDGLVRLRSQHPAEDGSERLLVELADGQAVESVLLPRDGLCVSTQVGCAVGCVFCMTGRDGLLRQVGSAEIVAQVALARARRPGEEGRLHGHGRAGAQPGQRDGSHRAAGHGRRHRPQEPGVLDRWRPARVRAPAAGPGEARAGPVAAHHQGRAARAAAAPRPPHDARGAGRGRRALRAQPAATRSSTSGRCWTASTTATTRSTASCACCAASTRS